MVCGGCRSRGWRAEGPEFTSKGLGPRLCYPAPQADAANPETGPEAEHAVACIAFRLLKAHAGKGAGAKVPVHGPHSRCQSRPGCHRPAASRRLPRPHLGFDHGAGAAHELGEGPSHRRQHVTRGVMKGTWAAGDEAHRERCRGSPWIWGVTAWSPFLPRGQSQPPDPRLSGCQPCPWGLPTSHLLTQTRVWLRGPVPGMGWSPDTGF